MIQVTAGQGLEHHKHFPILFFWRKVPGAQREAQWIMKALSKLCDWILPRTRGAPLKRWKLKEGKQRQVELQMSHQNNNYHIHKIHTMVVLNLWNILLWWERMIMCCIYATFGMYELRKGEKGKNITFYYTLRLAICSLESSGNLKKYINVHALSQINQIRISVVAWGRCMSLPTPSPTIILTCYRGSTHLAE